VEVRDANTEKIVIRNAVSTLHCSFSYRSWERKKKEKLKDKTNNQAMNTLAAGKANLQRALDGFKKIAEQ